MKRILKSLAFGSLALAGNAVAQQISVLQLDGASGTPFQCGDCLNLRGDTTLSPGSLHVVVLDAKKWPWIFARTDNGDVWINFIHVNFASRLAVTDK